MHPSLLLLPILLFPISSSTNNPSPAIFLSICDQNQTQNAQSFDVNFVEAMEKIHQNITATGFAASTSNSTPTVFGLGQCFAYLSSINCQLCYSQSRVKLPHCLPSTAGRIYLDGCFLEYADRNVSTHYADSSDAYDCSNTTIDEPLRPGFVNMTGELVGNLTVSAYREGYYRAGNVRVSPGLTVYGMAQCWKSLNVSGCRECLEKGRESVVGRCLPSDEGKAMNAGCFVRYSTEPFYLTGDAGGEGGGGRGSSFGMVDFILFGKFRYMGPYNTYFSKRLLIC